MKKILLVLFALMLTVGAFAQKAKKSTAKKDLVKAEQLVNAGINDLKANPPVYDKFYEAWTLLENCMQDSLTNEEVNTWMLAGRCQVFFMNKMINERSSNNGQFKDVNAFFDNQEKLVTYFCKVDELTKRPPVFGKGRPKFINPEEVKKNHTLALQNAKSPRDNLLIAGNMLMEKDPALARHYLDIYFKTVNEPLFAELNLAETDSMLPEANLFYAMSLMKEAKVADDTLKAITYLEKAIPSKKNGQAVLVQLMQIYHAKGDMTNWAKYCQMGVDNYPTEPAFLVNFLNHQMAEQNWSEALKYSDLLIERFPDKDYGYYQKGAVYYQQKEYVKALEAFRKTVEVAPESVDAWAGIGNSAWMLAQNNASDKALSKKYYTEAIEGYEKAHEIAPDRSDVWGYPLYAIYNNSGNVAKAKQYQKYGK